MPELPEVESVRTGLEKLIKGKKITNAKVLWPRIIAEPNRIEDFEQRIVGQTIHSIDRRGKFLIFHLSKDVLISHLRMEGKYRIEKKEVPFSKHTHVILELDEEAELRYLDVRKFGRMSLIEHSELENFPSLKKLGPEPIEEGLLIEPFQLNLKKRKKSIKAVLLDQTIVAGIGNIYADEILYEASIHPERYADSLKVEEVQTLRTAILDVMRKAVAAGGTTIRTYQNAFGETGAYQAQLNVYGRSGLNCRRCGNTIEKIKVAQRGTHFCPDCQN